MSIRSGIKLNIKKNASYYLTFTVVQWVDVFSRKNHRDAILASLSYCAKNKGLNIYAYCIMTNHIHLIVNCNEPFELKDVIRDFKRHVVKQIIFQIQNERESRREWMLEIFQKEAAKSPRHKEIKFWKSGNHAIELYGEEFTWQKVNYIHNNPVRAGFVERPEEWKYSSASNYILGEGILKEVYCLAPPVWNVNRVGCKLE